jgi:hypothetical protein
VLGKLFGIGLPLLFAYGWWLNDHDLTSRVIVSVFMALAILPSVPGRRRNHPWGAPVTPETQPALAAVIERVAERLRVPLPDRVWLMGYGPMARLVPDGRQRHLRLCAPGIPCLSRSQLEAMVAHELVLLRYWHPWLVVRLREAYLQELDALAKRGRLARRNLRTLSDFWSTVEGDADTAATMFAPAQQAAAALVVLDLAGLEQLGYALDLKIPRNDAIEDVQDGWERFVSHGDADSAGEGHADIARFHTTLATQVEQAGDLRLETPADRVRLAPADQMDEEDRRRLAKQLSVVLDDKPHWYTFATAPQRWWLQRAEQDAKDLDEDEESAELLQLFAEWRLLVAGWRHEHPAVRAVLVSPEGERADLSRMDNAAVRALIAPTLVP